MARQKKEGIKVTYYIKVSTAEMLEAYCSSTGIPKSVIVDKLITDYLEKQVPERAENKESEE
jgi:hypothetical protein